MKGVRDHVAYWEKADHHSSWSGSKSGRINGDGEGSLGEIRVANGVGA